MSVTVTNPMISKQSVPFFKPALALAGFFGFTSLILDAFGAHLLGQFAHLTLDREHIQFIWHRATLYQLLHALLLSVCAGQRFLSLRIRYLMASLITVGILFFCGGIYMKAILGANFFTGLTPIGGVAFMLSWLVLVAAAIRPSQQEAVPFSESIGH